MKHLTITLLFLAAVATLAAGATGCASSAAFKNPADSAPDAATVRAAAGVTIVELDGVTVASGQTINHGDQSIRATPGKHRIYCHTTNRAGAARWKVPVTLEASHEYRIELASPTAHALRVYDLTDNKVIVGPGNQW
jgi:hypothetical protein